MRCFRTIIAAVAVALAGTVPAVAATFDISWEGSGGYSLAGQFSFSDSLLGTGAIDENDIDALSFTVFLSGIAQGSVSCPPSTCGSSFNFNFDTTSLQFLTVGNSASSDGQLWNYLTSPVGFGSGSFFEGVTIGSSPIDESRISSSESTLTATAVTAVPLPAGLPLLLAGIAGLAGLRMRRQRTVQVHA